MEKHDISDIIKLHPFMNVLWITEAANFSLGTEMYKVQNLDKEQ